MSATAEEYRIAPEEAEEMAALEHAAEQLDFPLDAKFQEWLRQLDGVFAEASQNATDDLAAKHKDERDYQLAAYGKTDLPEHSAETPVHYARENSTDPEHTTMMLSFSRLAAESTEFADPAERAEFAAVAAPALLDELIKDPPENPSPAWQETYAAATELIALGLANDAMSNDFLVERALLRLNGGNAADPTALNAPETFLQIYGPELAAVRDRAAAGFAAPPTEEFAGAEFTAETNYAAVKAAMLYQMANALQERWPDLAAIPITNEGMQAAFQSQEFSSPEEFQQEAAAVAKEATAFFLEIPEGHPAHAGRAMLEGQLTKYLTTAPGSEVNALFGYDMPPTAGNLEDTLKAMTLWVDSPAEQPLDFADLTRQGIANAEEREGYLHRWELPRTSFMLYSAANYQTALDALKVQDLSDLSLDLDLFRDSAAISFHKASAAAGLPYPAQHVYTSLLENGMDEARNLNANAVSHGLPRDLSNYSAFAYPEEVYQHQLVVNARCLNRFERRATMRWELHEQLSGVIADQINDGSAAAFPEEPDHSQLTFEEIRELLEAEEPAAQSRWQEIQERIPGVNHPILQENITRITRLTEHPNFNPRGWDDEMTEIEILLDLDRRWQEKQGPAAVQQVQHREQEWQVWFEEYIS